MNLMIGIGAGWAIFILLMALDDTFHKDKRRKHGLNKFLIWMVVLFASAALFLIADGRLLPVFSNSSFGLAGSIGKITFIIGFFYFILAVSREEGAYKFLLVFTIAVMSYLVWPSLQRNPLELGLTALCILALSFGLFFFFRAFAEYLKPIPNILTPHRWFRSVASALLIPLGLGAGYYFQGEKYSEKFKQDFEKGACSWETVRFLANYYPWTEIAPRVREIQEVCDPKMMIDSLNVPLSPENYFNKLVNFRNQAFVSAAFENYRQVCFSKLDTVNALKNLEKLTKNWFNNLKNDKSLQPFPEDSLYRNLLLPCEKLFDLEFVHNNLSEMVNHSVSAIQKTKVEKNSEVREFLKNGNQSYKFEHYQDALLAYRNGLQKNCRFYDLRNNLGLTEWKLGNRFLACLHFAIIDRLNSNYLGAQLNQAVVEYENGFEKSAIDRLTKLMNLRRKYSPAAFNLGWIYDEKNKFEPAFKAFQTATNWQADYTNAWIALGLIYIQQKEYDKAEEIFNKAKETIPGNDMNRIDTYAQQLENIKLRMTPPQPVEVDSVVQ